MVSEYAPPGATKFLSYITGKCGRASALILLLLLIFSRLAHLPRMAGGDCKLGIFRVRTFRSRFFLVASEVCKLSHKISFGSERIFLFRRIVLRVYSLPRTNSADSANSVEGP